MKKVFKTVIKAITVGLLVGLFSASALFVGKYYLQGKLPPSTIISGIDLSYRTPEEAAQILENNAKKFLTTPLKFSIKLAEGEKYISVKPQDLGVKYMINETLETIKRINFKEGGLIQELRGVSESSTTKILYSFDQKKFSLAIEKYLELDKITPKDSKFGFGEKGELIIFEEKPGKIPQYQKLEESFRRAIEAFTSKDFEIELKDANPSVSKKDLEPMKEMVAEKLKNKIKIKYENAAWVFKLQDHLDKIIFKETIEVALPVTGLKINLDKKYLSLGNQAGERKITVSLDSEKLNKYIDETISKDIEVAEEPISIYTDESGKVVIKGTGRDGKKIQRENLKTALELAMNEEIGEVPLTTVTTLSPVTISSDLQEMGIKELLGVGHTSFFGSPPNRVHNINVGVERFNGVIVKPGEEFSFNNTLGVVDDTTGYKKELVITKDGTVPEYGGGLCQVSTTAYRAALFSGLPITARAPHSYAVSYYSQVLGYGLDATIYLGGQDFRFRNDTPGAILIQSYADGMHAYFKFYGTSDGRTVKMDGPYVSDRTSAPAEAIYEVSEKLGPGEKKQVERNHPGLTALWYRTVTTKDGREFKDEIVSKYKATQEKYLIGTEKPATQTQPSGQIATPTGEIKD